MKEIKKIAIINSAFLHYMYLYSYISESYLKYLKNIFLDNKVHWDCCNCDAVLYK